MPAPALRFGIVSGLSSAKRHLETLCEELTRSLDRAVEPNLLSSYAELARQVAEGGADIAWAPPLVALELERGGHGTVALCCSRGGDITYQTAIFTQHTSKLEKLSDLRGCRMAWVDQQSSGGYRVPRLHLAKAGLDPATLFGEERFLGSHERVSVAVLDGDVDAGATYVSLDPETKRPISAGWLEAGAGVNGAFILGMFGPIPSDAIFLSKRVKSPDAVRDAIAKLPEKLPGQVGRLLRADGFRAPKPEHFDTLRELLD